VNPAPGRDRQQSLQTRPWWRDGGRQRPVENPHPFSHHRFRALWHLPLNALILQQLPF
jgi:hypothetical protein